MTPFRLFEDLWQRADALKALFEALLAADDPPPGVDELLRAEWVARLAALDLYIHELVAHRMLAQFDGTLPKTDAYRRFKVSNETAARMMTEGQAGARSAFDLEIRQQMGFLTFQAPDKIADALRVCSDVKLWIAVAQKIHPEANGATLEINSKNLKRTLSAIVDRRNKIAHEGDLTPTAPREPWPITQSQVEEVRATVRSIVEAVEAVLLDQDADLAPIA